MKQVIFEIISNEALTKDVYRMILSGDTSAITAPGQFVEIALPGKFLRRPISVNDWGENSLTLIYKVVGHGTEQMALFPAGTRLDVLTGLGNGYNTTVSGDHPVLVGGGLFGFFGMALGVPIFAVIYRYISMNTNDRLRRKNQEQSTRKYEDYSKYDIEREELKNHEKPQK